MRVSCRLPWVSGAVFVLALASCGGAEPSPPRAIIIQTLGENEVKRGVEQGPCGQGLVDTFREYFLGREMTIETADVWGRTAYFGKAKYYHNDEVLNSSCVVVTRSDGEAFLLYPDERLVVAPTYALCVLKDNNSGLALCFYEATGTALVMW